MKEYLEHILPYTDKKRKNLNLAIDFLALVSLYLKAVLTLLYQNNINVASPYPT